jgi:hypothetical protein
MNLRMRIVTVVNKKLSYNTVSKEEYYRYTSSRPNVLQFSTDDGVTWEEPEDYDEVIEQYN